MENVPARLKHMDELGIDVQVMFNSLWITPLTSRADAEIALSWAWNRWLADVWRLGEDRLRWTCVVPALSPKEAVAQIRFAKEHGAVGVCMRPFERERSNRFVIQPVALVDAVGDVVIGIRTELLETAQENRGRRHAVRPLLGAGLHHAVKIAGRKCFCRRIAADPLAIDPEMLLDVRVDLTFLAGAEVHAR